MTVRFLCVAAFICALAPALAQSESFVAAPIVDISPVIDGQVAPGEWDLAAATCGFRDNANGTLAQAQVTVMVCADAEGLYCLYDCKGEAPETLSGQPRDRDSEVWSGSLCELFIAPLSWPVHKYAHLMLDHTGSIADELAETGQTDLSWNGDWQHAAGKTAEGWVAEMGVPWSVLGLSTPAPGQAFRANFARHAATLPEISTWAAVIGGFHHPEQFGVLALAEPGPVARLTALPSRATGQATVASEITGPSDRGYMTVDISSGTPEVQTSRSVEYVSGDGRTSARMSLVVPNATRRVEVRVFSAPGRLLLRQAVDLNLPDLSGAVAEAQAELRAVPREGAPGLNERLDALQARLLQFELAAEAPRDVAGLMGLLDQVSVVRREGRDLRLLADTARLLRGKPDADEAPTYFVTNPPTTLKVQPGASDPGPLAETVRISLARGEYEAAQIAVCPVYGDLTGVSVSVSRLHGPGSADLPRERIEVNPLGFVDCRQRTGGAPLTGRVPDVLLPDRAMYIPAGTRRPFFITVRSEPGDAPGEYRGYLNVRPDNAPARRIDLRVRVYDVQIPAKSHLRTAFVLWGHMRNFTSYASQEDYLTAYIRYSKLMLQHRLSPITMWPPKKTEAGEWDFSDYDRYLSETVPLGLTTLNIGGNGTVATTKDVDFAVAAEQHFREKGWWDLHYVYGSDEAPHSMAASLQDWYGPLVRAVPSLKIMQTGWSPHPELHGFVKIWCPLTASAQMESIRDAQRRGEEVWWYVCCGPLAPFANLFVDYQGVDHRVLGWQTFQHGIQGFLYWGVDVWSNNYQTKLDEFDAADYANWNPNSYSTINGDGYLLYPGPGDTPLASQRLALLRDGIEDYDLFTEAARIADKKGSKALKDLLNFGDLTPKLTKFPQDGKALMDRREAILKLTEQLVRG